MRRCVHGIVTPERNGFTRHHQGVEASFFEGLGDLPLVVPSHDPLGDEAIRVVALEYVRVERRRGEDEAVARVEAQVEDDQPRLAKQGTRFMQAGTTAVGQLIAHRLAFIATCDAIGKRVHEEVTDGV
jgi:hypothetical protein